MKNNKGFTLTELLVIVAIILSVLGIAVYGYSKISEKQKLEARKKVYQQVESAAEQYFLTNEYLKNDLTNDKYSYVSVGTLVENDYMKAVTDPVTGKQLDNCTIVKVSNTEVGIEYNVLTEEKEIEEAKIILGNNSTCKYEPVIVDPKVTRLTVNIYKAEKGCSKGELLDWKTFLGTTNNEKWLTNNGGWFNMSNAPLGLVVEFITSDNSSIDYSLDGAASKNAKSKERICITKEKKGLLLKTNFGNNINTDITINLDKTAPVCSLNTSGTKGTDNWFRSDVDISFASKTDNLNVISSYGLSTTTYNYTNNSNKLTLASDTNSQTYYGGLKDEAGNIGKCSVVVKRDTKAPTCKITPSGTKGNEVNGLSWYRSDVDLTLSCSDSGSALEATGLAAGSYSYNSQTKGKQTAETNKVTWNGIGKDKAGNEAKVSYAFGVDKKGPSCSIKLNGTAGNYADNIQWYKSNVGVTLECSDNASGVFEKGLAASKYTYNGLTSGTQSAETKKVTWGGIAKDNAGNEVKVSSPFAVDKTAPSCTINKTGTAGNNVNGVQWYRSDVNLSLSCSDSFSGLIAQGLASGGYSYNSVTTGKQSGETSGVTWYGIGKDKAGHEAKVTSSVAVDKTKPACSISRSGTAGNNNGVQWYKSNVGLTLGYSDDRSGVASKGLASGSYSYNNSASATQSAETKSVTWYGSVKDNAGNECTTSSNFGVDKTAPSISFLGYITNESTDLVAEINDTIAAEAGVSKTKLLDNYINDGRVKLINSGTWSNKAIAVRAKFSDTGGSGIVTDSNACDDPRENTTNFNTFRRVMSSWEGTFTFTCTIKDVAGNSNTATFTAKRDITAPICNLTSSGVEKVVNRESDNKVIVENIGSNSKKDDSDDIYIPKLTIDNNKKYSAGNGKTTTTGWYSSNVSLSLDYSDLLSGVKSYGVNADSYSYNSTATGTQTADTSSQSWKGIVKDKAGNVARCALNVKKDTVAPVKVSHGAGPINCLATNSDGSNSYGYSVKAKDATSKVSIRFTQYYSATECEAGTYKWYTTGGQKSYDPGKEGIYSIFARCDNNPSPKARYILVDQAGNYKYMNGTTEKHYYEVSTTTSPNSTANNEKCKSDVWWSDSVNKK